MTDKKRQLDSPDCQPPTVEIQTLKKRKAIVYQHFGNTSQVTNTRHYLIEQIIDCSPKVFIEWYRIASGIGGLDENGPKVHRNNPFYALEIPPEEKWNLAHLINLVGSSPYRFQNLETNLRTFWLDCKRQDTETQSSLNSIFERLVTNTRKYLQDFYASSFSQNNFQYDNVVEFVMEILPLLGANHIQLFDFFNNVDLLHFYWKKDLFDREFRPDYDLPLDENDLVSYHLIDTTFIQSFVESSSELIDDREKEILRFAEHVKRVHRTNENLNHCGRIFFNLFIRHHIRRVQEYYWSFTRRFADFVYLVPLFDKTVLVELYDEDSNGNSFKFIVLAAILCATPNETRIGWNKEIFSLCKLDPSEIIEEDLIDVDAYQTTIRSLLDLWFPTGDGDPFESHPMFPTTREKYLELVGLKTLSSSVDSSSVDTSSVDTSSVDIRDLVFMSPEKLRFMFPHLK